MYDRTGPQYVRVERVDREARDFALPSEDQIAGGFQRSPFGLLVTVVDQRS